MENTNKPAIFQLDELDLMLVRELEADARQSISALSRKLSVSKATVKKRLHRLLDEEAITITTFTDHLSLGFQVWVMIGVSVRPGKIDEVAKNLRSYKSIRRILLTTGRYDLLIYTVFHNASELTDFYDGDLSGIPYLVSAETMIFLDIIKITWNYLNDDTNQYQRHTPRDIDELDRKLIRELELCPRETVTNLGRKLGVNRLLAGKKLRSLLADNIIRVVSFAQPSLIGLNVQVCIFVKVQPGQVRLLADSLAAERRVHYICIITGRFQLYLNAVFRDLDEMSDFLRNHLGNYPGVVSHETLTLVAFAKRSYSLLT